jgi:hypothetical protein
MTKSEILTALNEGRERFLEAIEDLTPDQMKETGVVGEWSVKDILVHLTRWEAELVKLLWQASQGQKPTSAHFSSSSVDDLNARWYQESRSRPLERILEDFHGVRAQTVRRVEDFSDEDLTDPKRYLWLNDAPLWEWIAGDSFEHEAEHGAQIRAWRAV